MKYNIGKFEILVPSDWEINFDETPTILYKKENPFGAIQISLFSIDESVEFNIFNELYDFIVDSISIELENEWAKGIVKIKDNFLAFETIDKQNDRYFIFGICENNRSVMLITYNCESKEFKYEKEDVFKFFNEILFKAD